MHRPLTVVALITAVMITGCTHHTRLPTTQAPARAATSSTPGSATTSAPTEAIEEHDLAYGNDPLQQLDVYRPADASGAPIILMVHGGAWQRGDKAADSVVDNKMDHYTGQGYVFVSTNYRFVPQVTPVDQAADVAAALAFTQSHAPNWGGDPDQIVLMGHSAGANLVALVAADSRYIRQAGALPPAGTVALDSAAYDVPRIMQTRHHPLYDDAFGDDPVFWAEASPTLQADAGTGPMLLVCGSQRRTSCDQARALAAAGETHGARIQVHPIEMDHGDISGSLGTDGPLTITVDAFLESLESD